MDASGDGRNRTALSPGCVVDIVRKEDQRSGRKTRGTVQEILTNSPTHPHGIKVRLTDRQVGRVAAIIGPCLFPADPEIKNQPQPITPTEPSRK
jgi:uncharacterized repeat protein (TIGR03833 family)